jgi:hypothetical protein
MTIEIDDTEDPEPAIPDAHYAAVGKVANAWADLELAIDYLIWELMGVDQLLGACTTAQFVSVHPRMKAVTALARLHGATASADELDKFYGHVGGLAERRNRLIHDRRFLNALTDDVMIFHITSKKELTFGDQKEGIPELLPFRDTVKRKVVEFDEISDRVRLEIASSPKKPLAEIERLHRLPTHTPVRLRRSGPERPDPPEASPGSPKPES